MLNRNNYTMNINRQLSIFKRKSKDKVMEARARQEYIKPSAKRRQQHRRAVARERKRVKDESLQPQKAHP